MPTRQYIGARYVPKFADPVEWSNSLSYEALTMVTHLGNTFTSKIPVPAGVDISDTKYWANTGNYNAQVEQYRQEVVNLKNDTDKKFTALKFTGSKALLIGDSLNLNDGWGNKLANIANLNSTVVGNGSAGFVTAGITPPYNGMNILNTVKSAVNNMGTDEKESFDYVVVGCGINDQTVNIDTLKANVAEFFDYIRSEFVNAKIFFFVDHTFGQLTVKARKNYNAINDVAMSKNVSVNTELTYICFDNTEWKSDGVHMTADGYTNYAKKINNAIIGGTVLELKYIDIIPDDDTKTKIQQNNSTIKSGILHLSFIVKPLESLSGQVALFKHNVFDKYIGHGWTNSFIYPATLEKSVWVNPGGECFISTGKSVETTETIFIDIIFDSTRTPN